MAIQSTFMKDPCFFIIQSNSSSRSASTDSAFLDSNYLLTADTIRKNQQQPINIKMNGLGREWMDFLTPRNSHSPMLCSQRVLDSIKKASFTGYKALSVKLHAPKGKIMDQPWAYYWIIPTAPAYQRSLRALTGLDIPNLFGFLTYGRPSESQTAYAHEMCAAPEAYNVTKITPDPASWDGSDFNQMNSYCVAGDFGSMPCSRRVVDLAAKEKWTNVYFTLLTSIDRRRLDHLNGPWPPTTWYNPYEPV